MWYLNEPHHLLIVARIIEIEQIYMMQAGQWRVMFARKNWTRAEWVLPIQRLRVEGPKTKNSSGIANWPWVSFDSVKYFASFTGLFSGFAPQSGKVGTKFAQYTSDLVGIVLRPRHLLPTKAPYQDMWIWYITDFHGKGSIIQGQIRALP